MEPRDARNLEQLVHACRIRVLRAMPGRAGPVVALRPVQPVLLVRVAQSWISRGSRHARTSRRRAPGGGGPGHRATRGSLIRRVSSVSRYDRRNRADEDVEALGILGRWPAASDGTRGCRSGPARRSRASGRISWPPRWYAASASQVLAEGEAEVRRGDGLETHGLSELPDDREKRGEAGALRSGRTPASLSGWAAGLRHGPCPAAAGRPRPALARPRSRPRARTAPRSA